MTEDASDSLCAIDLRHPDDFEEESQMLQDDCKLVVLNRFDDVVAASQAVACVDLAGSVRSSINTHKRSSAKQHPSLPNRRQNSQGERHGNQQPK